MPKEISTIRRGIAWGDISLAVLDTTALVNEAIRRHHLSPVAAAALGRTFTAAAYLCSWLKSEESTLSVSVAGGGPGGKISVSGDGALRMRGFIEHPDVILPPRADGKLDVGGCVGKNGTLTVVRDDGEKFPFVGTSPLVSGEIAEDFSSYFFYSEQRPTAIALGVRIGKEGTCLGAGGVFLQPFPGAEEEHIIRAEQTIGQYSAVSRLIEEEGADAVFARFEAKSESERPILFRCSCSRERAARAIFSLGKEEAERIVSEEGEIKVHCHECNTDYPFGEEDIRRLFGGEGT